MDGAILPFKQRQCLRLKQYGIAIWISEPGRVKPIQAVGDWL